MNFNVFCAEGDERDKRIGIEYRNYAVIEGESLSVIASPDFCFFVMDNGETRRIGGELLTLPQIKTRATPLTSMEQWAHSWNVRGRVLRNYEQLLEALDDLGIDHSDFPKWEGPIFIGQGDTQWI